MNKTLGTNDVTGTPLGTIGGNNLGPFGNLNLTDPASGLKAITNLVSSIIGFMTVAAAIWFLFNILYGGYEWLSSGGDAKKLTSARDHLTHSFIGLVIVVGAWSIVAVAGQFFGFDVFLGPETIEKLIIVSP